LALALAELPRQSDARLLVGTNTADDAGVYLVHDGLALVQTVDVLTPVVPDAYDFGQIVAANSLSDVYAMGGRPLTALNVLGFPGAGRRDWMTAILRGAQDKAAEAGTCVVGGHTFNDPEIKFGMAVTGLIDPARIVTNDRARPGDRLILTKPLGTGTLSQAFMTTDDIPPDLRQQGIAAMKQLNRRAAELAVAHDVRSATDVTGFGLLGHLIEMALASRVGVRIWSAQVPILPGVLNLVRAGVLNPGIAMNQSSFAQYVGGSMVRAADSDPDLGARLNVLFESQNSGGLLIAAAPGRSAALTRALVEAGVGAAEIGEVLDARPGTTTIDT
jgi:selenide,water dikinase